MFYEVFGYNDTKISNTQGLKPLHQGPIAHPGSGCWEVTSCLHPAALKRQSTNKQSIWLLSGLTHGSYMAETLKLASDSSSQLHGPPSMVLPRITSQMTDTGSS